MAWAQEMKNLAVEIKTSHKDRTSRLRELKRETSGILREANNYIKKVAAELREMRQTLKEFLAKSEEKRKREFNTMMADIQAKIKEIKKEVKDLLAKSEEKRAKSEEKRMADFKAMMREVNAAVGTIRRTTRRTLADYKGERKEAAGHWASLRKGGVVTAKIEKVERKKEEK